MSYHCEALKIDSVQILAKHIPNAIIDNAYGPTENTIDCILL